jgi:hypothetical protein
MSLTVVKKKVITLLLALALLFVMIGGPTAVPDTVFAGDCPAEITTSC